ncbi:MAG: hypothetical protein EXS13_13980 [Planctomycetes bacterium]|nr:hypothetical protein [Planctomycetota bacterium]
MRFVLIALAVACLATPLRAEVRWQLDCKADKISSVTLRGVEGAGNYGYMTFSVSNRTGREVPLSFGVWAATDVPGRTYRGTIDSVVKAAVEKSTGKTYKTLTEVRGEKLADGASVELIVSFGKLDPNVDLLDVHVQGLVDRVYRDKGKTYVEDKVLVLEAARPGDEFARQYDLIKVKHVKWIALEPAKELQRS